MMGFAKGSTHPTALHLAAKSDNRRAWLPPRPAFSRSIDHQAAFCDFCHVADKSYTESKLMALAPEIAVSQWFNTDGPLTLSALRGRPVLLHAFQMLCPGCVAHGTPQTQRAFDVFRHTDLQVIGLHTVFEHHAAMTPVSLEAFIHEYRLTFPIGVDQASEDQPVPVTMRRFGMQGTPTTILIGRDGRIVHDGFGQQADMTLGAIIATELAATSG
jgi:peroxiredoxin